MAVLLYEKEERYRGGHWGGPFVHLVLVVVGEWPTQARVSKCPTTNSTFSASQLLQQMLLLTL